MNPRLLIIDDEEMILRVYARALGRDFVVSCAADVETAIALGDVIFDAILCDYNLPGLSPRDLHEHLRRRSAEQAARLVVITGDEPRPHDAFVRMLLATERYLIKTCPTAMLIATMRRVAFPRLSPVGLPVEAP